jgi:hypothetical protein
MIQDSELFTVDNLKDILKSFKITDVKINGEIIFKTENNKKITMFHEQSCCESVFITSKTDNLNILIGKTIVDVTETVLPNHTFDRSIEAQYDDDNSFTWTFYKFFYKGVDDKTEEIEIIWFGTSNGYYDEGVQFKCEETTI